MVSEADRHARVHPDVHAVEDGGGVGVQLRLVDPPEGQPRLTPDPDVLRDGQVAHQGEFLVDDADAQILRGPWAGQIGRACRRPGSAALWSVDAGEAFHQRRFARAVFAHQGMHFAGAQIEIDGFQRVNAGETLVDAFHAHKFGHEVIP